MDKNYTTPYIIPLEFFYCFAELFFRNTIKTTVIYIVALFKFSFVYGSHVCHFIFLYYQTFGKILIKRITTSCVRKKKKIFLI